MRVGILFNCQHRLLADSLRGLLPGCEVEHFELGMLHDPAMQQAVADIYAGCDHVISVRAAPEFGPLQDDLLAPRVKALHFFPALVFGGFHPDMVYVPTAGGMLPGITQHYHSRIAIAGFLAGLGVAATAGLYNALVFGRLGYFEAYARERAMAGWHFAQDGIDIAPLIDRWRERGRFMHSTNHPMAWAYADLAAAICRRIGLLAPDAAPEAGEILDDLAMHSTHPVLPPLAARLGLPAESLFRLPGMEGRHVTLAEFLAAEFESFATAAPEELLAVAGMADLVAMLR